MTANSALGLTDPIFDSQTIFRQILSAMSAPGTIEVLPENVSGAPDGISPAASAILLTLCDYETPLYSGLSSRIFVDWIKFYTGTQMTENPLDARFAVLQSDDRPIKLDTFYLGDARYPDLSTTLIIECKDLTGGPSVRLTGPGIKSHRDIMPIGPTSGFWKQVQDLHDHFPLGLDFIFTAGHALMALPRSTRIEEIG